MEEEMLCAMLPDFYPQPEITPELAKVAGTLGQLDCVSADYYHEESNYS